MFFKGALLGDPKSILVELSENTQEQRQIRFTNVQQIVELESIIKDTIRAAIEVERSRMQRDSGFRSP